MYGQKFLRGQIWWMGKSLDINTGSIQSSNRPHLIISNNIGNRNSPTLIVIPCTSEEKKGMPTHVICEINGVKNTILCEQIKTINSDELNKYMFTLSDEVMSEVEKAIKISLGIENAEELDKSSIDIIRNIDYISTAKPLELEYSESEGEIIPQIPIQFNEINRKGRVWDNETKSNFIEDCERLGIKTVSVKYNTKGNTKAYYKRFCESLGRPTKIG